MLNCYKLKTALHNSLSEEKNERGTLQNKGTGLKELTLAKYGIIQPQKYHLVKKEFISYTDNIQIYQGGIRGKFCWIVYQHCLKCSPQTVSFKGRG